MEKIVFVWFSVLFAFLIINSSCNKTKEQPREIIFEEFSLCYTICSNQKRLQKIDIGKTYLDDMCVCNNGIRIKVGDVQKLTPEKQSPQPLQEDISL